MLGDIFWGLLLLGLLIGLLLILV